VSMAGSEIEALAPGAPDACPFRLAKLRHRMRERIQHRLQVESRPADHLEHVCGGSLLLQRFAEIGGALAQLVEQSGVLDGDDGLTGEVLDEIDLLFGERTHFGAKDRDRTN